MNDSSALHVITKQTGRGKRTEIGSSNGQSSLLASLNEDYGNAVIFPMATPAES